MSFNLDFWTKKIQNWFIYRRLIYVTEKWVELGFRHFTRIFYIFLIIFAILGTKIQYFKIMNKTIHFYPLKKDNETSKLFIRVCLLDQFWRENSEISFFCHRMNPDFPFQWWFLRFSLTFKFNSTLFLETTVIKYPRTESLFSMLRNLIHSQGFKIFKFKNSVMNKWLFQTFISIENW